MGAPGTPPTRVAWDDVPAYNEESQAAPPSERISELLGNRFDRIHRNTPEKENRGKELRAARRRSIELSEMARLSVVRETLTTTSESEETAVEHEREERDRITELLAGANQASENSRRQAEEGRAAFEERRKVARAAELERRRLAEEQLREAMKGADALEVECWEGDMCG